MKVIILACLVAYAAAYSYSVPEIVSQAKLHYALFFNSAFPADHIEQMQLPNNQDFDAYLTKFGKKYTNAEEKQRRFVIFSVNALLAQALEIDDQGTATYGVTKFSDMSVEEFRTQYLTLKKGQLGGGAPAVMPTAQAPDSFDWRAKGAVTAVKDQGQCGSCWAFSTTGNIEGQWFIKKGKLVSLSESELVDCDKVDDGCNGGLMLDAFKEIIRLGGLMSEADYPYKPRGEKCKFDKSKVVATISGSESLPKDEGQLATWLAANGPISIGINADNMQFYNGGVAHPKKNACDPEMLDHGVLIVGYGVEGSKPFWIIKNSWAADWGEQGYYRVFRGGGVCGLNREACSSKV